MGEISLVAILIRFLLGGSAVLIATVISRAFGGRIGGIFAAFPAVYLSAILILALEYRGQELIFVSQQVSQGALVGMIADIICALSASYLILKNGWRKGISMALLIWLISASGIYYSWQTLY